MATTVTKKLSLTKSNIENYCNAQDVSFDVSDHAWRKWLNGSTDGYIILKDNAKSELYPTATAHPYQIDSLISASRSAGTCTVDLQFAGTKVHEESYTSGSQKEKSKSGITNNAISNSTRVTEIKWHVYGKNGDNQRGDKLELTLYFNQYTMIASVGNDIQGIKSVSASVANPYQGDSVTFSAELIKGATWGGWYSDAACSNLVSNDQNYTITAASDLTLYAKATVSADIYTCAAVAKDGIASATVSDDQVLSGESCTFAATTQDYYTFTGWYMDADCTILVSTDNPYTTPIVSNATFYAKGELVKHNISVAQPQDGSASVSASQVSHGASATFTCTPTKANREFYGWYKDANHTQLASTSATCTVTITGDLTLYPVIGKTRYTKVIHPVKLLDPLPYRGLVNGATPSQSIPVDVNKISNITLAQATSSVYAYQPHVTSAPHTYGMSMWFGADPLPDIPDNATITGIHAEFGYSLVDANYDSIKIGAGRMEYISDNDETPITDNASFAYVDETEEERSADDVQVLATEFLFGNRVSNYEDPMVRSDDTKSLKVQAGSNIITDSFTLAVGNSTSYPSSVAELKAGKLGFQINCVSQSTSTSNRRFRLHAFDLYVVYTIEDVSYKCDVVSDGHIDVSIESHDVAPGVENTWTARPQGGYRFDGWYSDANYLNLISTDLEYTQAVTGSLTLYAKSKYHSRVVTRVLDIPYGKGTTYFTGLDTNNKVLDSGTNGSGWKADMNCADYGWIATIGGTSDVTSAASLTNKSSKPYTIKAVLNTAAKDVLFPNDTAHMVRLDSVSELGRAAIGARIITNKITNPITGEDYVTPLFGGINGSVWRANAIHNVERIDTNIRHDWVLNVTKESEIGYLMHQGTSSIYRAVGINDITLTGYFEEYDYVANIASNSRGVRSATVNQAIGYEGDTITFTADVGSYVTSFGWYSDEACTQLVSTEFSYSSVPDANVTLYTKAVAPEGEIYTCQAVAKDNVATASVSESDMLAGGSVTFTATLNPGVEFSGWYSDEACTQLVSNQLSYTVTVNSNLILYAKGAKILYTIGVGQAEHGHATVSKSTAYYGDTVTFSCSVDDGYEFVGWYSDSGLTQLVSNKASYNHTIVSNIKLYPNIEIVTYRIKIGNDKDTLNGFPIKLEGVVVEYEKLTDDEIDCLRTGEYDKIGSSKIQQRKTVNSSSALEDVYLTLDCPYNAYIAWYGQPYSFSVLGKTQMIYLYFLDENKADVTAWSYYWYQPTKDAVFHISSFMEEDSCICTAIAKTGISKASATSPVYQGKTAIFEAKVNTGYKFNGWYSDEACTTLASSDNPASLTAPTANNTQSTLTLYAKADYTGAPPLSFKSNGTWKNVVTVFQKVNGTWVEQSDPASLFTGSPSGTESSYLYLGD